MYIRDDGSYRRPEPSAPPRHRASSVTESTQLTKLAERAWPHTRVVYGRDNEDVPAMEPGGRYYQLELVPVTEAAPIRLGDCKEAAEAKLRALVDAADLDAIAMRIVTAIKSMKPGELRPVGTRKWHSDGPLAGQIRCTRKGRVQFAVRGDELRDRILAALGPGWSYTKHGGWWDRP
jgi:hypothetical protein